MMEYWLQLVNEQALKLLPEVEAQKQELEQEQETTFISVFSHQGSPIIPPLMTPQRRREMQNHRSTALAIEGYLKEKNGRKSKVRSLRAPEMKKEAPPLSVVGRFPQQLQRSETLIYDNGLNRIIKPPPRTPPSPPSAIRMSSSVLIEDPPLMAVQRAAVQLCAPLFAKPSKSLVARATPPAKPLIVGPPRAMSKLKEQELEEERKEKWRREREKQQNLSLEHKHTMKLIQVAKTLPWGVLQIAPLLRSNTHPVLRRMPHRHTEANFHTMPQRHTESSLERKHSETESSLQLHPQLWKRQNTIVYSCPNSPRTNRFPTTKNQEKETQEEAKKGPEKGANEEPKQRKQSLEKKPKSKGRFSLSPRRPAPPHNVSWSGHNFASSMSSVTQRRRSYDPQASLMRDAKQKVAGRQLPLSPRQSAAFDRGRASTTTHPPSNTPKETLSALTIHQAEAEEQRQRFLALVSKQAEEQQRLQAQFEAQQQILIDQMLGEVKRLSSPAVD
ncbi:uncharacterized protein [Drosophila pseudoobscura]|uniref:Uncharacterized protein n=1 Tax=Drosophila pseudoobscura pseudoobscura TaxID=46245 RepID=A0A6I8UM58_DROPS|nr:uncharacterized protein LOC4800302 [Drosophila pseudoobscura]